VSALLVALAGPGQVVAQQTDGPLLQGQAFVGDSVLGSGTVVLHEVTTVSQGEIDSVRVAPDGTFTLRLPAEPDRVDERFYFASLRHDGILYFGSALTEPQQLDSLYRIQAYDTLAVPVGGREIPILARNIFFEPAGEDWQVTDIFQLRNEEGRTLVSPEGDGAVWRYPLPEGARDFNSGQDGLSLDGSTLEEGSVVVRAAIAPGDRVFVFRYVLEDLFGSLPTPGVTGAFDLLVREPSPRVGVEGLELVGRVELEAGSTYRRYSGADVGPERVRLVEAEVAGELPVEWIAVLMGMALAVVALVVMKTVRRPGASLAESGPGTSGARTGAGAGVGGRQALLLEVARLDEAFAAEAAPSDEARASYEARRADLMRRLKRGS
jgi:hypothetical protein